MSVMIRGMTMPDMCSECDFLCGLIYPDGIYVCDCPAETIHGSNVTRAVEEDARHPECPLVEVPEPHGRLIDADALEAVAEFYETELELRKAPIVIEAEGK